MSEQAHTQQTQGSLGGLFLVVLGWAIFVMVLVSKQIIDGGGAEAQSPLAGVTTYAVYGVPVVIFLVSLLSLLIASKAWVLRGGSLNMVCAIVASASTVAVITLGLLRVYGKI